MGDTLPAFWLNGRRQSAEGPHLSGRDRGLTFADGVFETMCAHGLTVFRLDRHLERLRNALAALEIPAPPQLRSWVIDAVRGVGGSDMSVRLTVTRGIGAGGIAPSAEAGPTVLVAVAPLPVFPASVYDVGLIAHVASGRRNEHAMTAGLKTLAYTEAVAALLEAQHARADEALFLDTEGRRYSNSRPRAACPRRSVPSGSTTSSMRRRRFSPARCAGSRRSCEWVNT